MVLVYSINWIECTLRVADFCEKLEIDGEEQKCNGKYSLSCADILCAKDRYSCQSIRLLHGIKNIQKTEKGYLFFQNNFEAFMKFIRKHVSCFLSKKKTFTFHLYTPTHHHHHHHLILL